MPRGKTPHFSGFRWDFGVFRGLVRFGIQCTKRGWIGTRSTIVESGSRSQTLDLFKSSIKWVSEIGVPFLHMSFRDPILAPFGTPLAKTCSIPRYHGNPMIPDVLATPPLNTLHSARSVFGRDSSPEDLNISILQHMDLQTPI